MAAAEDIVNAAIDRDRRGLGTDPELEAEIEALLAEAEAEELAQDEAEIESLIDAGSPDIILPGSQVRITPSQFTEFAIKIPVAGSIRSFSFEEREYLRRVYDSPSPRILMKCARQTEKSTGLGNISLAYASLNLAFKVLFVTATAQQATVFSVDRVREVMEISPVINGLTTTKLAQNVFFKQLRNRSQIRIRYAFLSADRVRGISADLILIDEIQDIIFANVPIIEQCASHSAWKIYRYSGTPKSLDNTIEKYWADYSTQNEWAVPCERHSPTHWNILGERNIGKKGPICDKCGKQIYPMAKDAKWVAMQPKTESNQERVTFEGFRVPQLMVPWVINNEKAWNDNVLFALNRYDRAAFYNEVLGLSYDSGVRPLTRAQIMACCQDELDMSAVIENASRCRGGVYAGIDWGIGENNSYTLLTLGGEIDGVFTIFYAYRFTGREIEPPVQLEMIARLFMSLPDFRLAGCDYGMGYDRNDWLARTFGPHKIKKIFHVGRQKEVVKWNPKMGVFTAFRTEIMSILFNAIKRGPDVIRFPNYNQWAEPYGADMLNIFSEYSEQLRMLQYKLSPGKSDDTFHSVLFCLMAYMIENPQPSIMAPIPEGG